MSVRLLIAATIVAAPVTSAMAAAPVASPSGGPCKALADAVENGRKELSYQASPGRIARSAPQATQQATEVANAIALIGLNIQLMAANRCPMPMEPVSTFDYIIPAMECSLATGDDAKEKCNRASWKPIKASEPKAPSL